MKKRTLIVAAILAAMTVGANAQENLCQGTDVEATASSHKDAGWAISEAIDGNWGSWWEPNLSEETSEMVGQEKHFWYQVDFKSEKTFDLVKIKFQSANTKKFKLRVSNDGETWTDIDEFTTPGVADKISIYRFKEQTARYIRIWATDLNNSNNFGIYEFQVMKADASKLTTVSSSIGFVKPNEATDLSFTFANQYGEEISSNDVTLSFDGAGATYENGKLTTTEAGKVTIKATYDNQTVETSVYAVDKTPELVLDENKYAYYGIYGADALNCKTEAAWNTAYNQPENGGIKLLGEMTIDGTKAIQVSNIKKLLIGKSNVNGGTDPWGLTNTDEYTDATIAIFPDRDVHVTFDIEGDNVGSAAKDLKGGEWNYIIVSGFTAATNFKFFDILADAVNGEYPNMLISNVYLSKNIEASVLTSAKANTAFVREGVASDLALTYYDQKGQTMENPDVTIKSDDGTWADGKFTANKSGNITVNVLSGNKTVATLSFYAMAKDAVPTLNTEDYLYKGIYGASVLNCETEAAWNTGWNNEGINATSPIILYGEMDIDGTKAIQAGNVKKILIGKSNGNGGTTQWELANTDGYSDATIAIFPDRDVHASFQIEGGVTVSKDIKGGEWNYITVSGLTSSQTYNFFDVLAEAVDGEYPSMLITNVALRKANPNALIIGSEEDATNGFVKVEGSVTAGDHLQKLEDEEYKDVTAFDLSNVTFGDGVTSLNMANKNAMIQVAGTVENGVATIAESAKAIENTPNLVVKRNDGYYFPIKQLQLVDGYTAYTSFVISAGNIGYKYTRNVESTAEGGKWISITSPVDITNIPEGIIVYEGVADETEEKTISFNKVSTIEKNKPYIAWAKANVTLEGEGTGDLDMESKFETTVEMGNDIKFHANYIPVSGEGKKYYGIYKGTTGETLTLKRIGATAKLGSFRAYLEMPESTTEADVQMLKVKVSDGIVNSIYRVETEGSKTSATGVYSLDGRLVRLGNSTEGLEKGVYVVGGKKVVVK